MSYVTNIRRVFNQATQEEVGHGLTWYKEAHAACQAMADAYELPIVIVIGVVAALSPTNRWERNLIDADNMLATFTGGGYCEACAPCTYKAMRDKAWKILSDGVAQGADDVAKTLNGPKITDFFWCIMGEDVCVIDGHAWCIANADRRTMQEVPSIGKKLRKELQAAYSKAGKQDDMTAFEMQAATWVAWKRIHNV
mgnify:CR=1 FL=1|jgi:hypothetical protein|tara:strand:- start:347 stop:934 length:588 start_codon:yes stop_codon:yes gene_type:complete